jgi:hypothetical protein
MRRLLLMTMAMSCAALNRGPGVRLEATQNAPLTVPLFNDEAGALEEALGSVSAQPPASAECQLDFEDYRCAVSLWRRSDDARATVVVPVSRHTDAGAWLTAARALATLPLKAPVEEPVRQLMPHGPDRDRETKPCEVATQSHKGGECLDVSGPPAVLMRSYGPWGRTPPPRESLSSRDDPLIACGTPPRNGLHGTTTQSLVVAVAASGQVVRCEGRQATGFEATAVGPLHTCSCALLQAATFAPGDEGRRLVVTVVR